MSGLVRENCIALTHIVPQMTDDEAQTLHAEVPAWEIVTLDGIKRLRRTFKFSTYADGLNFTNQIAQLAEQQGHHPRLITDYAAVTVEWWTHVAKGLHRNDFIMAAKSDQTFGA